MESLKEQIENRCKHFTGIGNKKCSAGVVYIDVKEKTNSVKIPCFKKGLISGGKCSFVSFPTKEEVKEELREQEEVAEKHLKAYEAVKTHIKLTGEMRGKIKCTSCGCELFYMRHSNGHIWGKCNCGLEWME